MMPDGIAVHSANIGCDTASVYEIAITVVGRDRPGIVADVSARLAGLGLNLTDSTMTLLRGHFAMVLVCSGDVEVPTAQAALSDLDVDITVAPAPESGVIAAGTPYTLVVHGADRLGIVAAVTSAVAGAGGNITDLTTRLAGELYVLTAELTLPASADADELATTLASVGRSLGVEVTVRPADTDLL
jgi:glycine cleavage system transcriptional repressor